MGQYLRQPFPASARGVKRYELRLPNRYPSVPWTCSSHVISNKINKNTRKIMATFCTDRGAEQTSGNLVIGTSGGREDKMDNSMHTADGEQHAERDKSKVTTEWLMNKIFDFPLRIPIPFAIAGLFD